MSRGWVYEAGDADDVAPARMQRQAAAMQVAILDALPAHIALIDTEGVILAVNASWRHFATVNRLPGSEFNVGENYLCVCDGSTGAFSDEAPAVALGMRRVLSGQAKEFSIEYPCHSPTEHRWFRMMVTPLHEDRWAGAVVMHINVTERVLAETALQESEERFRATFEQAAVGLAHVGTNGYFLRVNHKLCEITGYPHDELLQLNFGELTFPEDLAEAYGARQAMLSGEQASYFTEKRYRRKNGETVWINLVTTLVREATGKAKYFISVIEDITTRKQTEKALQDSAANMAAAQRIAHFGSWELEQTIPDDMDASVLRWSDEMFRIAGFEPGVVPVTNALFFSLVPAEEHALIRQAVATAIRERQPYSIVHRLILPDGHERIVHETAELFFDESTGHLLKMVGTAQDITERRRAEEALRASEEKFRQLADNITDVFWITSPDFQTLHYISAGYEQIWGRSMASLYAHPHQWIEAIVPEEREAAFAVFAMLMGDTPKMSIEYRIARPDGTLRWVHDRGFQVRDAAGTLLRLAGIVTDITERKKAEAALEQMNQQLLDTSRQAGMAEVATNVLHNVGNVLNSVNISANLVIQRLRNSKVSSLDKVALLLREHSHDLATFFTSDPRGQQLPAYLAHLSTHLRTDQANVLQELDSLRRNIDHIIGIVAMQQSYAKVSGVRENINILELVDDSLRMNEGALSRHLVKVVREFQDVPSMSVEKHKVLQILVNLLRNAKHACDHSGRTDKQVTVRVTNGGGRVRVAVIDNGIGILSENLTRVFSHGFTTKKNGHGFGLHSGALAAKEMGGALAVRSDGPGQGATFTLELPCETTENAHE